MIVSRQEIQAFRHWAVIHRFQRDFPKKAQKAEQIFEDLMLFFWGTKQHEQLQKYNPADTSLDFIFMMDDEMKDIDHMWHVFLLYTKDYMNFCEKNFQEYLHHLPDIVPDGKIKLLDYPVQLERFLIFVQEHLGEKTIERWFPLSTQAEPLQTEAV